MLARTDLSRHEVESGWKYLLTTLILLASDTGRSPIYFHGASVGLWRRDRDMIDDFQLCGFSSPETASYLLCYRRGATRDR